MNISKLIISFLLISMISCKKVYKKNEVPIKELKLDGFWELHSVKTNDKVINFKFMERPYIKFDGNNFKQFSKISKDIISGTYKINKPKIIFVSENNITSNFNYFLYENKLILKKKNITEVYVRCKIIQDDEDLKENAFKELSKVYSKNNTLYVITGEDISYCGNDDIFNPKNYEFIEIKKPNLKFNKNKFNKKNYTFGSINIVPKYIRDKERNKFFKKKPEFLRVDFSFLNENHAIVMFDNYTTDYHKTFKFIHENEKWILIEEHE